MRSDQNSAAARRIGPNRTRGTQRTISELATLFGVSLRTLRFYEGRGLLVPQRRGTARLYSESDEERLTLILEAKRLGFTLTEIRDLLTEALADPRAERLTLRLSPEQVMAQLDHLERQRRDIEGAITNLRTVQTLLQPG